MANDFLPFSTSGTANVYTNAEYIADTDHTNGNQPGIAKSKLVNKALRQCSIISTVVAQYIADITGTNSVDDGTTATLLANLKLATKGMIGANIASSATTSIGGDATGDVMHVTGTTTITSLGVSTTGRKKTIIFDGILTLTHNATSLILPGAANITTSAGSVGAFDCIDGALGYWKCIGYVDDVTSKSALKTYFDQIYAPINTAGSILQVQNYTTGTYASGTTTIPLDNTIPQITEGTQFLSLAFTPKKANSILKIQVIAQVSASASLNVIAGLFRDSTVNAVASGYSTVGSANFKVPIIFETYVNSNAVTLTTFTVRIGCESAGTIYLNGAAGAQLLGGVLSSSITITEIMV